VAAHPISDEQLLRYARHVALDEIGEEGQARLLASRALVVGAGGLGSPVVLYLAAAGVGRITIVDDDRVDLTNLQRQIAHTTARLGEPKAESAAAAAAAVNPEVRVDAIDARLDASNAMELVRGHDVVVDGTDNFAARFLLNDACHLSRVPLVSAALLRFEGQLSTFKAWTTGPCYRCLHPEPPPEDLVPRCEQAGILGAVAGVMGAMQAAETVKELLGIGESLAGTLLLYDALSTQVRRIAVPKNPDCALCGQRPRITTLAHVSG
jgi:adenylyltransferase/sulfurtransferase